MKEKKISFKELYWRSLTLADYLSDRLGEDNKIILISQNSLFFITCYLAIIKSGNVCVPLNPSIEQENLSYIESLTQCKYSFASDQSMKIIHSEVNYSMNRSWMRSYNPRRSAMETAERNFRKIVCLMKTD